MKAHSDPRKKKARILVADDHASVRKGIIAVLAADSGHTVVGEAKAAGPGHLRASGGVQSETPAGGEHSWALPGTGVIRRRREVRI